MIEIKSITSEETLPVRHEVLWPNKPIDYVRIENDEEGKHYGLYLNNLLVSVISVFIKDGQAQYRKFATLESHQGKGYGSMLFEHMLNDLEKQDIRRIWCNARLDANAFYKRYGFKNAEGEVFYKGTVGYTIMEKLY